MKPDHALKHRAVYLVKNMTTTIILLVAGFPLCYSQCPIVNAGPDQIICDLPQSVQLQGSIQGSYSKFYWTPINNLSDPNVLDPTLTTNTPGTYKFTLHVEGTTTNLIINGDFESGNSGFNTQYSLWSPPGQMPPGNYNVDVNPAPYYAPEWSSCSDHTSGSGKMFFCNGSNVCGKDFWCQTVTVTPNTDFDFEVFFASIYPQNPPEVRISFNGKAIQTVPLSSNPCDWLQFKTTWNSGASTSLTICMQDLLCNGQWGNDLAMDDISLYASCKDTDEVKLILVDLIAQIDILKKPKCASEPFELTGLGSSVGSKIAYVWLTDFGEILSQNGLSAIGKGSGTYTLKVIYTDGNLSCEKEAQIVVNVKDALQGSLEVKGKADCSLDTILLKASVSNGSGNYKYQWTPGNRIVGGQNDSFAYVIKAGSYKVHIIDLDSGCEMEIQELVDSDTLKPNLQISGDTLINCVRNTILLTGSPFDTSKYSYEWQMPDSSRIKNKDSIFSKSSGMFSLKIIDKSNKCSTAKIWNVKIDTVKPNVDLGPDQKIDCINSDVAILPTGNNPNATINYYWTLPSGSLPVETNLISKKVNSAGQAILHLVDTKNNCEDSDTMSIEDLRKIPNVDAGIGTTLNCKVKDFTLDGTNTKMDSSTFVWSTINGKIISGANTLNPIINAPGWYYLNIEDTINHCKNLDSVFIDQNIQTPNAILGPDKIFTCADSILTIDGSKSSQDPQLIYFWNSLNGVIISGQGSPIIKIKSAGDYYLIVLDTINFCSDTDFISVKPDLNSPLATIAVNDTLSCKQTSIPLFGNASSPSGDSIIYTWGSSAGQFIQNANSLTPIVNQAGEYILSVIDQINGCITTVKAFVSIDTIKPNCDAGPDNTWNCSTTKLILDGSNSTGNHGLQYQWTTPDGSILSNPQQSKIDIGAPGTYLFKVIDLENGCESTDQSIIQKDINVPIATVQFPDTLNCIHSTVTINGQGSSIGNSIIYTWKTIDGQIIGAIDQIKIVVDKPGNYQLIVTDTINKCNQQQSVLIIEDKKPPIVDAGSSTELSCQLLDLILTGNSVNLVNPKVKWTTNQGNILSKPDSIQIKINKPGIYYLEVTNPVNGCVGSDSVLVNKINNLSVDAGLATELTCKIKEAILSGSMQNNAGNEQIIWTTNQGHFIGSTNSSQVKIDRPGWYYFVVTNNLTGCNGIDSVLISENTNYPASLNLDVHQPKCPGDFWQTEITNITGGEKPIQVYFNNQLISGLSMLGNSPGNYIIKVVDKNGCELSTSFDIISPNGVTIQLISLIRLSAGQDYNLVPIYSIPDDSIASVQWSPSDFLSCTDCPYPIIKGINRDIEYTVTYSNRNGCSVTTRIRIELIKNHIWVPNAFSANGDNINDSFYPFVSDNSFREIRIMQIFDRWGNQLFSREHFQPNDPDLGWKGTSNNEPVNPGTFIYLIEIEWNTGESQILHGDVTLIR